MLEGRTPDEVASDMLGCTDAKGQPSLTCPPGPVGCCTPTGSEGRDEQCYYAVDAGAERGACVMFGGRWSSTP